MKSIWISLSLAVLTVCFAGGKSETMLDVAGFEKAADQSFAKHELPRILAAHRELAKASLPPEKAAQYLKYFEQGLHSPTGMIMIEGGENAWLERVYHAGFAYKEAYRAGYLAGMAHGPR